MLSSNHTRSRLSGVFFVYRRSMRNILDYTRFYRLLTPMRSFMRSLELDLNAQFNVKQFHSIYHSSGNPFYSFIVFYGQSILFSLSFRHIRPPTIIQQHEYRYCFTPYHNVTYGYMPVTLYYQ